MYKMLINFIKSKLLISQASRTTQNNAPSSQQLRLLVQHIQVAVSAGYLNHQVK